jgi:multiple sugar transport system permease protein
MPQSVLRSLRKYALPYLFVAPMVIVLFVVMILPILRNIWMSFFDWYLARPGVTPFIGLENYIKLFNDRVFIKSLNVTAIYVLVTVPARFMIGLGIALLLNYGIRFRGFFRSLIIIPWAVPEVIACLIFVQMFDFQYGIINHWLVNLGIISESLKWLSSPDLALLAAMIVNIWKGTPWAAIMLLAGLQSIPNDLYEASDIDGANIWQKFLNVTLPLLKPISLAVFLLLVIWTVKDFGIVYVLNKGGPVHATEVLTIYIYHKAFQGLRMGIAAAGGVILLTFSMIFTVIYLRILEKEERVW